MKTALALGTFDGLHKGHREVLRLPAGMKKTAVIFSLPPKALLTGKPLALMLPQDKETALENLRDTVPSDTPGTDSAPADRR